MNRKRRERGRGRESKTGKDDEEEGEKKRNERKIIVEQLEQLHTITKRRTDHIE